MLILIIEVILGVTLYRTLKSAQMRNAAKKALFLVGFVTLAALSVLQLELAYLSPDGTYGSDARYYYELMQATVEANVLWPEKGTLSPGYIAWGAAVLHSSPTNSVVWVKLANIGLFLLIILLGFNILEHWGVRPSTAYFATLLYGLNGIVLWTVIRNLKDTLLLFLTLAHVLLSLRALSTRWSLIVRVGVVALLAMAMWSVYTTIRPWGLYWSGAVFVGSVLEATYRSMLTKVRSGAGASMRLSERSVSGGFALLLVSAVLIAIFLGMKLDMIQEDMGTLRIYSASSGGLAGKGLADAFLAVPRFLIGPGPIRALFGWEVFQVTTTTGNVMIALGSLLWWLCILLLVGAMLCGVRYWGNHASILVMLLIHIAVYSFAYSGSVDTRHRAIIYVTATLFMAENIAELRLSRFSFRVALIWLVALIVWLGGLYESYRSLVGG